MRNILPATRKKQKMARPKKKTEDRRNKNLQVRLKKAEYRKLRSDARKASLTLSNYVRAKLLEGEITAPKVPVANLQAAHQLRKIGVNLNQLARYFNSHPEIGNAGLAERLRDLAALNEHHRKRLLSWSDVSVE